jgi:hypothetical protein
MCGNISQNDWPLGFGLNLASSGAKAEVRVCECRCAYVCSVRGQVSEFVRERGSE